MAPTPEEWFKLYARAARRVEPQKGPARPVVVSEGIDPKRRRIGRSMLDRWLIARKRGETSLRYGAWARSLEPVSRGSWASGAKISVPGSDDATPAPPSPEPAPRMDAWEAVVELAFAGPVLALPPYRTVTPVAVKTGWGPIAARRRMLKGVKRAARKAMEPSPIQEWVQRAVHRAVKGRKAKDGGTK